MVSKFTNGEARTRFLDSLRAMRSGNLQYALAQMRHVYVLQGSMEAVLALAIVLDHSGLHAEAIPQYQPAAQLLRPFHARLARAALQRVRRLEGSAGKYARQVSPKTR